MFEIIMKLTRYRYYITPSFAKQIDTCKNRVLAIVLHAHAGVGCNVQLRSSGLSDESDVLAFMKLDGNLDMQVLRYYDPYSDADGRALYTKVLHVGATSCVLNETVNAFKVCFDFLIRNISY